MAYALNVNSQNKSPVLLGYQDAEIDESDAAAKSSIDFQISKIGGSPKFRRVENGSDLEKEILCPVCGLARPLLCQIYAPLESSVFHRTLYVFACVAPTCWNNSKSWSCLRIEVKDKFSINLSSASQMQVVQTSNQEWLDDQDDWGEGDEDGDDIEDEDENGNNGNEISNFEKLRIDDNNVIAGTTPSPDLTTTSDDLSSDLSINDNNANSENNGASVACGGGSITSINQSSAYGTAEIEADQETDVVIDGIEAPALEMLRQNSAIPRFFGGHKNAVEVNSTNELPIFRSFYIYVEEETRGAASISEHERKLLMEYKAKEGSKYDIDSQGRNANKSSSGSQDVYEKAVPKHGDHWFHKFLSAIQENPGQILRYSRERTHEPLFLTKPDSNSKIPSKCIYCSSGLICEVQLLPSMVSILQKLKEESKKSYDPVIEFGTALIFTCVKSCWTEHDSFRREQVWVQAEPI